MTFPETAIPRIFAKPHMSEQRRGCSKQSLPPFLRHRLFRGMSALYQTMNSLSAFLEVAAFEVRSPTGCFCSSSSFNNAVIQERTIRLRSWPTVRL